MKNLTEDQIADKGIPTPKKVKIPDSTTEHNIDEHRKSIIALNKKVQDEKRRFRNKYGPTIIRWLIILIIIRITFAILTGLPLDILIELFLPMADTMFDFKNAASILDYPIGILSAITIALLFNVERIGIKSAYIKFR